MVILEHPKKQLQGLLLLPFMVTLSSFVLIGKLYSCFT